MKALMIIWIPMEVIKNSKEPFVKPKHLIWNGGTDRHTDRHTDRQTDPCIELRYAQLINNKKTDYVHTQIKLLQNKKYMEQLKNWTLETH